MATSEALMGIGAPAEMAIRTGWTIVSIATADAGQGSGPILGAGNKIVLADPASGDDAVTLPAGAGIGDEIIVHNDNSGVSLDVFPATGHTINSLTANQGVAVANNTGRRFIKVSATRWLGVTDTALTSTT